MNVHNVITYVQNFDQSDKFQVVFEAHGSSYDIERDIPIDKKAEFILEINLLSIIKLNTITSKTLKELTDIHMIKIMYLR